MNEHTVLLGLSCFDSWAHALLVSFSMANWSLCLLRRQILDASWDVWLYIVLGTMVILFFLFWGVGNLVFISAYNFGGSDQLS